MGEALAFNGLTVRQEKFAVAIAEGKTQHDAWKAAGYSCKYKDAIIDINACQMAAKPAVRKRIIELQEAHAKAAIEASVMGVLERKQRLSEIARANLTDFMELGQDGSWVNIGPETKKAAAISEIHSRTEYDDDGAHSTVHTSVKLHSPIQAIEVLNKMDKIYAAESSGGNTYNTQYNIIVSEAGKILLDRVLKGEGTDGNSN